MSDFNPKALARSKHHSSLTKDKNRWKKKGKHLPKQGQAPNKTGVPQKSTNQTEESVDNEDDDYEDESDEEVKEGDQSVATAKQTQQTTDTSKPQKRRGKYSRRGIESNEFRYKEEVEEEEEFIEQENNIHRLLEAAATSGPSAHFRFQTEKEWDDDELLLQGNKSVGGVNMDLIAMGITNQLSLSQQLRISEDLLPSELLSSKSADVLVNEQSTGLFLPTHEMESRSKPRNNSTPKSTPSTVAAPPVLQQSIPTTDQTQHEDEKLLNELMKLDTNSDNGGSTNTNSNSLPAQIEAKSSDDLESWLDTVI